MPRPKTLKVSASIAAMIVTLAACSTTPQPSEAAAEQVRSAPIVAPVGYGASAEREIRQSFKRNAALSAIHRTWHFYENASVPAWTLYDTLTSDTVITTPAGTTTGLSEFQSFVDALTVNHDNGHRLVDVDLQVSDAGSIAMTATVDHIAPDAASGSATLTPLFYEGELAFLQPGALAKILSLEIGVGERSETEPYENAYANNRLRSLAYHFHAMIEDPDRAPESFDEVLAENFTISTPGLVIDTYEGFSAWINGISGAISATEHVMDTFAFEQTGENVYRVKITYNWRGITTDGTGLKAKSQLVWQVEDDPAERFARIKSASLEFIAPVSPISAAN